jgi:hypothetical protein
VNDYKKNAKNNQEVIFMSYVDPKIKDKFESLSIDLKNEILKRDVKLYTLNVLIKCLETIVKDK